MSRHILAGESSMPLPVEKWTHTRGRRIGCRATISIFLEPLCIFIIPGFTFGLRNVERGNASGHCHSYEWVHGEFLSCAYCGTSSRTNVEVANVSEKEHKNASVKRPYLEVRPKSYTPQQRPQHRPALDSIEIRSPWCVLLRVIIHPNRDLKPNAPPPVRLNCTNS